LISRKFWATIAQFTAITRMSFCADSLLTPNIKLRFVRCEATPPTGEKDHYSGERLHYI
jgi:hypothetical protein